MTVKELIDLLSSFPDDARVYVLYDALDTRCLLRRIVFEDDTEGDVRVFVVI